MPICMQVPRDQGCRMLVKLEWCWAPWSGYWELNLDHLKEQYMYLTAGPSFQPHFFFYLFLVLTVLSACCRTSIDSGLQTDWKALVSEVTLGLHHRQSLVIPAQWCWGHTGILSTWHWGGRQGRLLEHNVCLLRMFNILQYYLFLWVEPCQSISNDICWNKTGQLRRLLDCDIL